jgi:hypothetical protein
LDAYARCHYETINRVGWAKAKADEQEWAVNAYQDPDVEMKDAEEEEEEIEGELEDVSEEEGMSSIRFVWLWVTDDSLRGGSRGRR